MINVTKFSAMCLGLCLVLVVACGKKDDGGGGGAPVAVGPNANCMNGPQPYGAYPQNNWNTTCGNYFQSQGYGYQPYPYGVNGYNGYDNQYRNGFCACPGGYRPVLGQNGALGCMNSQILPSSQNYLGYSWNNTGWINTPQQGWTNTTGYNNSYNSGYGNGCYQDVVAQCDITIPNSCGFYGVCQPNGGGNRAGTCIRRAY